MQQRQRAYVAACFLFVTSVAQAAAAAEPSDLPAFDFHKPEVVAQWKPAHDVGEVRATGEGMEVVASGNAPFLVGPAVDLPVGAPLALEIKVRSERGGTVEVFYFSDHATAGKSVSARVAPGAWEEVRLRLPPMGRRMTFRIDPPAVKGGRATIASMTLRRRVVVKEPQWPQPLAELGPEKDRLVVRSGNLSLVHDGRNFGRFQVRVSDALMASSLAESVVGFVEDEIAHFVPVTGGRSVRIGPEGSGVRESVEVRDASGGRWMLGRSYTPGPAPGTVTVETTLQVDRDRQLIFAPMLVLLPGAALDGSSSGTSKTQALLSGLEYLGRDDASSSEADVVGPASNRRIPDSLKLTIPLMALSDQGSYVAIAWEDNPLASAFFDSPDRTFGGRGHAMGLLAPGSGGSSRSEGALFPEMPFRLKANFPITVKATILGGRGGSIVPAVKQYVLIHGLPPAPATGMDAQAYARFAAGGWLDSKIREGALVRHAVWPGFGAQHAADAAVWMRWLAAQTGDDALAGRLNETAASVAAAVAPEHYDAAAVSHVRYPVASLVLGQPLENAREAEEQARALLKQFEPDGSFLFRRDPAKADFARSSPRPTSNGLTATHVSKLLELAAVSGDREVIEQSLRLLRALDAYKDDVPRGAQSWEVPLHTPDILASAMLVRAYLWGYELSGDRAMLERANDWAWTGVPFAYLRKPVDAPVGLYATIPVYGATNWVEPVWFGRPVQWCGLVYADALYRLAEHDPSGPWKQIADGITASGIQQCWPVSDRERQGLLPDFYHLRSQTPDGPAINPGTLQANAVRLFGGPKVYDFRRFPRHGMLVHAPGSIEAVEESDESIRFTIHGWSTEPYWVLLAGLAGKPSVRVNGANIADGEGMKYDPDAHRAAVRMSGTTVLEIRVKS